MRQSSGRAAVLAMALLAVPALVHAQSPAPPDAPRAIPGFDPSAMDRRAAPCDDFYQFACGGWIAKNPVPPDRGSWTRFDELQERNQMALRDILDKASRPDAKRAAIDQRIGDYYASCMDEAGIEKEALLPVKADLDRIAALPSKAALAAEIARLHTDGVRAFFGFGSVPDFKNASVNIAGVDQGGLSLPDRDYYLKDEPRFADVRKQYPLHVQKMLELAGETPAAAAKDAQTVLEIETALAKVSLERVKRREPSNLYHKMTREELAKLAPGFDWSAYFTATKAPAFADLNVAWPDFFKGLDDVWAARSLDDLRTYLRWHAMHDAAPLLPAAFVNENFDFYGKTPHRGQGAAAAVEALRPVHGRRPRRGARPALRRGDVRRGGQGADARRWWPPSRRRSRRTSAACPG